MYRNGIGGIIEPHRSFYSYSNVMVTMIGCKYCMVGCASCIYDLHGIGIIESHRSFYSCPWDVMMVTMIECKYCMVGCASCIYVSVWYCRDNRTSSLFLSLSLG
jgi:hypothetical protein